MLISRRNENQASASLNTNRPAWQAARALFIQSTAASILTHQYNTTWLGKTGKLGNTGSKESKICRGEESTEDILACSKGKGTPVLVKILTLGCVMAQEKA